MKSKGGQVVATASSESAVSTDGALRAKPTTVSSRRSGDALCFVSCIRLGICLFHFALHVGS